MNREWRCHLQAEEASQEDHKFCLLRLPIAFDDFFSCIPIVFVMLMADAMFGSVYGFTWRTQ
eukprot:1269170-Prymnesium_polylepis.1